MKADIAMHPAMIRHWPGQIVTALAAALGIVLLAVTGALAAGDGGRLKVVTTFTVLADMAAEVAGDHAEVVAITRPGVNIHSYEPTPRDMVRIRGADLILWNGLNLEAWFERFLSRLGDVPAVVLTDGLATLPITTGASGGKPNPHAWMGLDNAPHYIDAIAAALASHDPAHAADYAANAATYKQRLQAVLAPLRDRIAAVPEGQRWLATCEGAFSYLARDLGLREVYLWPINTDQMGTPQQVRQMIDTVREHAIPAVFCESTVNQAPAQQVARETGARYGGMLFVDSLSEADGPVPTYLDLLRVTVETIAAGLTGDTP